MQTCMNCDNKMCYLKCTWIAELTIQDKKILREIKLNELVLCDVCYFAFKIDQDRDLELEIDLLIENINYIEYFEWSQMSKEQVKEIHFNHYEDFNNYSDCIVCLKDLDRKKLYQTCMSCDLPICNDCCYHGKLLKNIDNLEMDFLIICSDCHTNVLNNQINDPNASSDDDFFQQFNFPTNFNGDFDLFSMD